MAIVAHWPLNPLNGYNKSQFDYCSWPKEQSWLNTWNHGGIQKIIGTDNISFYGGDNNGIDKEWFLKIDQNPFNEQDIMLHTKQLPGIAKTGINGGFITGKIPVDITKKYRMSVWVKRDGTSGRTYFGSYAYNITETISSLAYHNNSANTTDNPYYIHQSHINEDPNVPDRYKTDNSYNSNEWYLYVGYINPYESPDSAIIESKFYDRNGRTYSNPNMADWKFLSDTTYVQMRTYLYYNTAYNNAQEEAWWYRPRVDIIDGTEPTINDLVEGRENPTVLKNKYLDVNNNYELTNYGATLNQQGKIGTAYQIDTGDYIQHESTDYQNLIDTFNGSFSISSAIYLNSYNGVGNDNYIFSFGDNVANELFSIKVNDSHTITVSFNTVQPDLIGTQTLLLNQWYNLLITCDYTSTNIRLYIDGVFDIQVPFSQWLVLSTITVPPRFGAGVTTTSENLYGKINDFRIYNHVLEYNEIKDIFYSRVLDLNFDKFVDYKNQWGNAVGSSDRATSSFYLTDPGPFEDSPTVEDPTCPVGDGYVAYVNSDLQPGANSAYGSISVNMTSTETVYLTFWAKWNTKMRIRTLIIRPGDNYTNINDESPEGEKTNDEEITWLSDPTPNINVWQQYKLEIKATAYDSLYARILYLSYSGTVSGAEAYISPILITRDIDRTEFTDEKTIYQIEDHSDFKNHINATKHMPLHNKGGYYYSDNHGYISGCMDLPNNELTFNCWAKFVENEKLFIHRDMPLITKSVEDDFSDGIGFFMNKNKELEFVINGNSNYEVVETGGKLLEYASHPTGNPAGLAPHGDTTYLYIDGIRYGGGTRGLNVYVLDTNLDQWAWGWFDTYYGQVNGHSSKIYYESGQTIENITKGSSLEKYAMKECIEFIDSIPDGYLVLISANDAMTESSFYTHPYKLSEQLYDKIKEYFNAETSPNTLYYRSAWYVLAEKNGRKFDEQYGGTDNLTPEDGTFRNVWGDIRLDINIPQTVKYDISDIYEKWNMYSATYNSITGLMSLFVNGQTANTNSITPQFLNTNDTDLLIGSMARGSEVMNGSIDNVTIAATDFEQTDIEDIYNGSIDDILRNNDKDHLLMNFRLNGNLDDSSGNGNELTEVNTGTGSIIDNGKIGKSYKFFTDSSNNGYFYTSYQDKGYDLTNGFSVAFWITIDGTSSGSTRMGIMETAYGAEFALNVGYDNDGSKDIQWYSGASGGNNGSGGGYESLSVQFRDPAESFGVWHHVVIKYDKSVPGIHGYGTKYIYIDGELKTSTGTGREIVKATHDRIDIGTAYTGRLNGRLNDVRIYDTPISDITIKDLYQAKILDYDFNKFKEYTKNLAANIEGHRANLQGTFTVENLEGGYHLFVDNFIGSGVETGWAYNHIHTNTLYTIPIGTWSFKTMIRVLNTNEYADIDKIRVSPYYGYSGDNNLNTNTQITYVPLNTFVDKGWIELEEHYLTVVGSGITNSNRSCTFQKDNNANIYDFSGISVEFYIQIEQKDMYTTEFTPYERTAIVRDKSEYSNNTILDKNTPRWINNTYSFNGIDNYFKTPILFDRNETHSNDFTISIWIYPIGDGQIIAPNSAGIDHRLSYVLSSEQINVGITESTDTNNRSRLSTTNSVPANTWTHIAVTINKLDIKIYINGLLDSQYTEVIPIAEWLGYWRIGSRPNNTSYFNGMLDEFKVYATTLSDTDILEIYNQGR